jgi:hypothetical protein
MGVEARVKWVGLTRQVGISVVILMMVSMLTEWRLPGFEEHLLPAHPARHSYPGWRLPRRGTSTTQAAAPTVSAECPSYVRPS